MIICIGREFGSGGHEIGKCLAEQLDIPFHDQGMIEAVLKHCENVDISDIKKVDEKRARPWKYDTWYDVSKKELRGMPANDVVFQLQSQVILDFAAEGNCVFVGRCADYILKKANIERLSLFITAPFDTRVKRKAEQLHISEREAAALVKKMDKQRKSYYDYYTGGSWGKAYNYDFCINSYAKGSENYAAELKSTTESLVSFVSSIR